ncbi:UbiA prenyltransferase family protein [Candidatus Woesebacteria bacterium]|nr:UbiA prenyltransferase family protein [Candidatus Woesebacteria bacterium]
MKSKLLTYARALRVNQWIKNVIIYSSILFAGKLFDTNLFLISTWAVVIYCLLSSASYLLNDIIDYQYDKKHPTKRFRPVASGKISIPQASFSVFLLSIVALLLSLSISISFFLLALIFLLLHFYYSLHLKKLPVVDIFVISLSFVIRTLAGVAATGYHVPIWLLMTVFFMSLFMASVKRHSELVNVGTDARESLLGYRNHLLYFLSATFATLTIVSYALYTYTLYVDPAQQTLFIENTFCDRTDLTYDERNECQKQEFTQFIPRLFPSLEARKLMMVTIPFVVYGVARYAQLLYDKEKGERPEKLITTDKPLIGTIFLWGLTVTILIYIL